MFGFVRMMMVLFGSLILSVSALNQYVEYGAFEEFFSRFPGYFLIRGNAGLSGAFGAILIIAAFVFPSGAREADGEWKE